jgi:hypothetical protein
MAHQHRIAQLEPKERWHTGIFTSFEELNCRVSDRMVFVVEAPRYGHGCVENEAHLEATPLIPPS